MSSSCSSSDSRFSVFGHAGGWVHFELLSAASKIAESVDIRHTHRDCYRPYVMVNRLGVHWKCDIGWTRKSCINGL